MGVVGVVQGHGWKVHQRSARATERGKNIHLVAMILSDVLAPNACLRFNRNLLADCVWMVLVE